MQKVQITIAKDTLNFSYCVKSVSNELLNTNVISDNELVFSVDYLKANKRIVSLFLNDLGKDLNISKISISRYSLAQIIVEIINPLKYIKELKLLEENSLPYELCEVIIENKSLEKLDCFSVPSFMAEILDRNNIYVQTRCEVLFTSAFMEENNLSIYSKMYYTNNIKIGSSPTNSDLADFETFCKINRYLKVIHLHTADLDLIKKVLSILEYLRLKNIRILLHNNINDVTLVDEFKKLNKTYKEKYNISLRIVYSDNYLKENISKQVILNILKTCALIIILICLTIFGSITYNNYLSEKKVEKINAQLEAIIKQSTDKKPEEGQKINNKFLALMDINPDTVGWIKLNKTNIDYPVVKTTDNEYYLSKGFTKESDYNGWVFMDYRNNVEELGRNTIIYGHNRYSSGIIFGTLGNALKKEWYMDKENQIIIFDTIYEELRWQIFSVYQIKTTVDYIQTGFPTEENYIEFINMIEGRSIYDFGVNVDIKDKILTLSTCLSNNRRLVVHAVLLRQ